MCQRDIFVGRKLISIMSLSDFAAIEGNLGLSVRALSECYLRPLPPHNTAVLCCAWEASVRVLSRGSSVHALESLHLFMFCWLFEVLDSQEHCGLAPLVICLSFVMIHLSLEQSFLFISGLK